MQITTTHICLFFFLPNLLAPKMKNVKISMLINCWWESKFIQTCRGQHLSKLEMHMPFDPVIPFYGIYPIVNLHRCKIMCVEDTVNIATLFV